MSISNVFVFLATFIGSLAFIPLFYDLGEMVFIGFRGEDSFTYRADIPLGISFLLLLVLSMPSTFKHFRCEPNKFVFNILLVLLFVASSVLVSGLGYVRVAQLLLLPLAFFVFSGLPKLSYNSLLCILVVTALFVFLHAFSVFYHFDLSYLEVNHNFFYHEIFSHVFGFFIYSGLVVYSSALPLIFVFFLVFLKFFLSRGSFPLGCLVLAIVGLISALLLMVLSGRKLLLVFIAVLFVYVISERKFVFGLLKHTVVKVLLSGGTLLCILQYEVFLPSVDRLFTAAEQGNLDGSRAEKVVFAAKYIFSDWMSFLFGSGQIMPLHNYFATLMYAVGAVGACVLLVWLVGFVCLNFRTRRVQGLLDPVFRSEFLLIAVYLVVESCVNVGLTQMFYLGALVTMMFVLSELGSRMKNEKGSGVG